ncbi:MAG: hypothetical protein GX242_02160 [Clostridiales bacterium]|nr:hypothetical protein [Clostridiales bacterium]
MNTTNFEQMAREYRDALANMPMSVDSSNYLEQIITLNENQLDCIFELRRCARTQLACKLANYLKNLIFRSLAIATRLLNGDTYLPSFRNPHRFCSNALARLINAQIDIFVVLDRLSPLRNDLNELIHIENRKMAILAAFNN